MRSRKAVRDLVCTQDIGIAGDEIIPESTDYGDEHSATQAQVAQEDEDPLPELLLPGRLCRLRLRSGGDGRLLYGLRMVLLPLPPQGGNGRDMFHRGEGGVAPVIRACVKAALRTQQSLMFLATDRAFQAGSPPFVFGQLYHNLLRLAIGVTNAVRKLLTNDNSCATMKTQRLLKNDNWRR